MTVDSSPTTDGSPRSTQGIRPSRSSSTACQVVGLGRPERLADGAATGPAHARRNAWAHLMLRHAHSDRIEARSDNWRHVCTFREHKGERSREEAFCEAPGGLRREVGNPIYFSNIRDVSNKRIVRRPPLGLEHLPNRRSAENVRPQSVYRFGGEGRSFAGQNERGGLFGGICDDGLHGEDIRNRIGGRFRGEGSRYRDWNVKGRGNSGIVDYIRTQFFLPNPFPNPTYL